MTTRAVNGAAIKALREALGISQHDLAERAEITQGALSHIESGRYKATLVTARKLADGLGVSLETITYPVAAAATA